MFLVINKEKICAYIVSIVTVVMLFCMSGTSGEINDKTVETSSNSSSKLLPIYNVQTEENKVALTMNCAWSQHRMG